jgi:hypothetical protein
MRSVPWSLKSGGYPYHGSTGSAVCASPPGLASQPGAAPTRPCGASVGETDDAKLAFGDPAALAALGDEDPPVERLGQQRLPVPRTARPAARDGSAGPV